MVEKPWGAVCMCEGTLCLFKSHDQTTVKLHGRPVADWQYCSSADINMQESSAHIELLNDDASSEPFKRPPHMVSASEPPRPQTACTDVKSPHLQYASSNSPLFLSRMRQWPCYIPQRFMHVRS